MKNFNRSTYRAAALLLCSAGLVMSSASAQQDAPPPPSDGQTQGPPPGGPGRGGPDHRLMMMQSELQLSPDQTTQMKQILADQRAKMEALRTNSSLAPREMRQQMMAIHEDSEAKVHAILTPDQRGKYDAMEAKMREHGQRRGMGGTPPSPPPPPPQ
jgi:protein CpxP